MKNMTLAIVGSLVAFAISGLYGGQSTPGVAGVDVVVKQTPGKRTVTDAHGNFAFDALPPGPCVLAFRAREAKDLSRTAERRNPKVTTDKVTVASSYSIKIEGTKRPVNQSGLTSDKLTGGIDIAVEVGSGAKVRGQVLAAETMKMVWIPKRTGSNMPGHWVPADSAEAKSQNITIHSPDDLRDLKWNANMIDPKDPRNEHPSNNAPR